MKRRAFQVQRTVKFLLQNFGINFVVLKKRKKRTRCKREENYFIRMRHFEFVEVVEKILFFSFFNKVYV